ncbi:het-domain-containing protein [Fusarium pseudoanthophilum]|uniref:Het-domain-containing protein n=1 Tax=Fusarium pseudoanthophilum TaxID=48495 RepID=A0A8H5UTE8_9HYPO|nr:het-domain-containing protein [Fusarium pseudoanthophilum]
MLGSDLVGLITPTIRTVEIILDIYKVLKDTDNIPEAFHKVAERLPLVQGNLLTIARSIRTDAHEEDYKAMGSAVAKCKVKAEHLKEIFNAAISLGGTFVVERYISAARRSGKVNRVEVLAMKMLEDVRFLVENRSVPVTTQPRVALLDEAIEDLSRTPPSLWDEVLINSGPGNQYMDDHIGYISSIIKFGNTFSGSDSGSTVTWVKDVQRAAEIPSLMWELPWFEQSSRFPVRLPWDPCTTKDCVLPNGHLSSHEIWKPCTMDDCSRHRDHDGDHRMISEELSEINARFQKRAKAAERFWRELADTVLEAMGYPQPEGRRRSKMARPIIRHFENTIRKAFIQSPILPRGVPSLPYRKFVLENRQIRLFQLEPGTTTSSIRGSFICADISSRPVYTALSYTWGDGGTKRKIMLLDQGELAIGDNLWSFLRLQSSIITEPTSFWIDAICIDQSNTLERNHQVGLMRQIYTSAAKVYVWLGQEEENSDVAMRFVAAQASKPLRPRGSGYNPIWSRQEGKALHTLCDRRYWRRMWIIQELLHANDITVWCGSLSFTWDDIEKLYLKLKTIEESNWFAHHEYHLMVMQSSAAVMVWQRAHWRHPDTPVPRLQTLIEIFRDWQCTDLRDKVFALSGMATKESTVEPDYTLTTREVYFAVLQHVEGQQEQFRALLAQTFGLAGRDVDLHGQNMYSHLRYTRCAR